MPPLLEEAVVGFQWRQSKENRGRHSLNSPVFIALAAYGVKVKLNRNLDGQMTETNSDAIIRMFHVHKRYGAKSALKDLTLDVFKNEFLFVTGRSGAGKTTLLKLLYLGEAVSEGQILVDGMNLSRIERKRIPALRRLFGIIFQDYKLIPPKTV